MQELFSSPFALFIIFFLPPAPPDIFSGASLRRVQRPLVSITLEYRTFQQVNWEQDRYI